MAKITVVGEAVVVTSEVKLEDIEKVGQYRPDALILYEGDEKNKQPIFRVGVSKCTCGRLNSVGAEFGSVAKDGSGKATITMVLPKMDENDDPKEVVAGLVGSGILHLNKVEAKLPEVIREIDSEHANILSNIAVM